jgi:transcription antitermination factor NusG
MHGAIAVAEQIGPQSARKGQGLRWYVILMTTGLERRACIWMRLRGLQPYWPRFRVSWREFQVRSGVQWRGVLPGYMFLPCPLNFTQTTISDAAAVEISTLKIGDIIPSGGRKIVDFCQLVEKAPGVRRFVRNGNGELAEIPDKGKEGMEKIRDIEASLNANPIAARDGIPFKVGQVVDIKKLEKRGKILRLDGRRRIIIEVFMFNRFVTGTFSVADIEAV